ncbi:MAG: thioredoxin domain-containing protein [Bacteroidota bacterium]|jgi:uncharacterized protein YyaL (SSP411 family)|nr:thioredoxin domain-containing protein [Sphingobacteriales bacterium]
MEKHSNRLIHASSPYLLQHAHNPVDWYEWGAEAFDKARREDKLILVSIGYSACHWCHVMEKESFEKQDTAALMNEHFVCIKVDREERPDIDQIYMDAVQLLTGRGGWPLNCFTLPDGRPLHGGTYFPKAEWERVLKSLADFYKNKKEEALKYAADLTNGIKKLDILPASNIDLMATDTLAEIILKWSENLDREFGGFNWSPKFPMPAAHALFMQFAHQTKNKELLTAVYTTLDKMAEGGIFDQIGGGFARYATDHFWKVPHFEKMLYDNAQLMSLYSDAYKCSGNQTYRKVAYKIHAFIDAELSAPNGLFYSALDADSEGEEGKYYVWKQKELKELLAEDEPVFSLCYSVDAYGNWEHGNNILYKTRSLEEMCALTGKNEQELETIISKCESVLLKARNDRVKPGLDDKIITSWNALMIKGYADAYMAFGDEMFLNKAVKATDLLWKKMFDGEKLYRICKGDKVTVPAFAEDYALFIEALLYTYIITGIELYACHAQQLAQLADELFFDTQHALYRFVSLNEEQLITNKLDLNDDVIPSANSVFAKNNLILGYLFSDVKLCERAKGMVSIAQQKMEKFPNGYSNWMQCLLWMLNGFYQVVCTGKDAGKHTAAFQKRYVPGSMVLIKNAHSSLPLLKEKEHTQSLIYICKDFTCGLPETELRKAIEQF